MHIVCFSSTRWDFLWQRPQQIMSRLSDRHNILYVDHFQPSPSGVLLQANYENCLTKINKNLHVFSPRYATRKWLLNSLNSIYQQLGIHNPVLWVYFPTIVPALGEMDYSLLCYDCVDDFSKFSWNNTLNNSLENALIGKSDVMFVTSQRLKKLKSKFKQNICVIPNGADVEHFSKVMENTTFCPEEMRLLNKPVVGFIGAIYEWVDLDLIEYLCISRPDWSFVLVGPKATGVTFPLHLENLYMPGRREYKDLPGIIKGFDVCIIPFKINELTASTNPVKLYEYLASGKPVVSTPIPEAMPFRDIVNIAKDPANFLIALEKCMNDNKTDRVAKRLQAARENSWDIRIEQMERIIKRELASKQKHINKH